MNGKYKFKFLFYKKLRHCIDILFSYLERGLM